MSSRSSRKRRVAQRRVGRPAIIREGDAQTIVSTDCTIAAKRAIAADAAACGRTISLQLALMLAGLTTQERLDAADRGADAARQSEVAAQ